ncbi:Rpp14/Pop5 family-domain-containing protein [Daldinia caldariorum]|uniref:Rpp14/Pop5 family-domain-containing protein n=1 Tax=Daldinia caldariorum TaxID=326644 RepID=UPI00200856BE|nr:Rpp14/Pop5 family-domain-containing protein [Daldinia caldariorum]KAI1470357.1 Rpp14/Pop5 family-domain-containing protein [Daldinia caldariorum]
MVRIKERYLLVKILYPTELGGSLSDLPDVVVINQPTTDQLNPASLLRAIRAEVANFFGDYGSGLIEGGNLGVKYFSPATSTFILRISRSSYRLVWAALTFMNSVPVKNGKPCVFRVVHRKTIKKKRLETPSAICSASSNYHNVKTYETLKTMST